jgi:hypothetical protein
MQASSKAARACSAALDERHSIITSAPFLAHDKAVTYPNPLEAPVTTTFLPERDGSSSKNDGYSLLGLSLELDIKPEYDEPRRNMIKKTARRREDPMGSWKEGTMNTWSS